MTRAWLALLAVTVGCGGAPTAPATTPSNAEVAIERATEAWATLDPERAAREAERAIRLAPDDAEEAREIAARAHLVLGRWDRAARATEGASSPALLRLRARAFLGAGDLAAATAALDAAARADREEDPWTAEVLPALRAASEDPYAVSGRDAAVALEPAPLPVVRVQIDAIETLAVVGTGAWLVVLDPSVRDAPGAIDELTLGTLRVSRVPHTVRSLEAISEALGMEIGAVIGADLLLRLAVELDGPAGALRAYASPPSRDPTTSAALLTPSGFLAIEARRGEHRGWLTLDTAGLYPVALGPGGDEALGLTDAEWAPSEAGPELTLADVRLGDLAAEGLPIVRGLLDEGHARAVEAPVAGAIGWVVLSQLRLAFDPLTRRLRFE